MRTTTTVTTPEVVDLGDVVFAKRPALVTGASFFNLSCCLFKPRPFIGAGQGAPQPRIPGPGGNFTVCEVSTKPGNSRFTVGRCNYIQPGGGWGAEPPKKSRTSSKPLWFDGHCFALQRALVLSTSDATKSWGSRGLSSPMPSQRRTRLEKSVRWMANQLLGHKPSRDPNSPEKAIDSGISGSPGSPRNPSRSIGLVALCILHQKSATETDSKLISWPKHVSLEIR